MKLTNKMLLLAILSTTLVACGKKDEPAAPATPAATPAPAAPASSAPVAPVADPVAAPVTTPATVASTGDGLPAECEAYLKRAEACYAKAASANAAAVTQMQQGLEQVRTQWNAVPDKSQLGEACKMADTQFTQTVTMLKCE